MARGDGNTGQVGYKDSASVIELKNLHAAAKSARQRYIPEWHMNLAFFLGHQWLAWNRGRLYRPSMASWRRTPVDNRILPIVTSRTARKVKNRPTFVCTPFTADEADIEAAKVGEKILEADWTGLDLQQSLYQAELFAEICGAGFWKIYWDSSKGKSADFLYYAGGDQAVLQADNTPVRADVFSEIPEGMVPKTIAQGDICVDVLSPFELFPDPLALSLEECEWVIEEKVRSVEYVKSRFGVELPPDTSAPGGPVEARMSPSLVYSGETASEEYKGIRVYEYWARPSTKYPNGKRCVWAREQILLEEDHPFDAMPYVMFEGIRAPNRFWPTALTTHLRGPQTELNKVQAQIAENADRIGNPALLESRHANVEWSGRPGERVKFDATLPDSVPSFLQPPEMPVYVREQLERIENSMAEISGIHDVSKAQVPTGVTAASAINLLQEADDTRIGPEIQQMEVALAKAGTKILRLRAKFNNDERLIRIAGEDGNWDIFSFRGQVLGQEPNVEVQAGSAMPRSKAAKQAAMFEILSLAFQYGLQFEPRDLRKFFKDYEVGGLERLFDSISQDEQQIQRENRLLSQGTAVNINAFDNDEVHVAGHDEFRKTGRYGRLPGPVKGLVDAHVLAHQERMAQKTNLQVETMGAEQQAQQLSLMSQQQAASEQEAAQQAALQQAATNGSSQ